VPRVLFTWLESKQREQCDPLGGWIYGVARIGTLSESLRYRRMHSLRFVAHESQTVFQGSVRHEREGKKVYQVKK
jgi:hypothetical protein